MSTTRVNLVREEGVVEAGGTRVILASATGVHDALTEALKDSLGEEAAFDVYFAVSRHGAKTSAERDLARGLYAPDGEGLMEALKLCQTHGLGRFELVESDIERGWAKVFADNSFEASETKQVDGPICHSVRGTLVGLLEAMRGARGLPELDLHCVEPACAAAGAARCEFYAGTEADLRACGQEAKKPGRSLHEVLAEALSLARRSEQKYQKLVETIPIGFFTLDMDGGFIFANKEALRITGRTVEDLGELNYAEIVHADDLQTAQEGIIDVVRDEADPYPRRVRILSKSGESVPCDVNVFARRDEEGRPVELHGYAVDVSANALLEWQVHLLEGRYRSLLDNTAYGFFMADAEGKIIHLNRAAVDALGLDGASYRGARLVELVSEADREKLAEALRASSRQPVPGRKIDCDVPRPDGILGKVSIVLLPVHDGKKLVGIHGPIVDVTERARLEKELRSSEARFRSLVENLREMVFMVSDDGKIVYANPSVRELLGFDPAELRGRDCFELLQVDEQPNGRSALAKVLAGEKRSPGDWKVKDAAGGYRIMQASAVRAPSGVQVLARDVTEQRAAEARARELEEQYRSLIENVGALVFGLDSSGRITTVSRAAEELMGRSQEELRGRPLRSLVARGYDKAVEKLLSTGRQVKPVEVAILRRDGTSRLWRFRASPVKRLSGEVTGFLVFGEDVSAELERKKIEAERDGLAQEVAVLRSEVAPRYGRDSIIYRNEKMRAIVEMIDTVADSMATVLITGDTGTGKELVAKAIHYNSPRKDGPFVKVDCGALTETLLESELFGHEKGAFTGATRSRPGRFEIADGGTIFLDEIGNLPVALQSKLLRVVQEGKFEKVGGTRTIEVDVRVIAATNQDIEEEVAQNKFRKDLYYRLNVIHIHIPPLRQRRDDTLLLAHSFLDHFARRNNRPVEIISHAACEKLVSYDWPGNVRELENIIEQAVVLCRGKSLGVDDIRLPEGRRARHAADEEDEALSLKRALQDPEKDLILRALEKTRGNKKRAAEFLGISRSSLYEKLKKHKLLGR